MTAPLGLFALGLCLSAFFSGAETGFYRMTRLRLVMEASTGDRVARAMLWLANQPSLVVATLLVGNNLANYLASLGAVLGIQRFVPGGGDWADLITPLVVTPVLFVGGELFPKNLFFHAPNRLMRRCSPMLALCVALFAPITAVLWLLSQLLRLIAKQPFQELRSTLARRELNQLMTEGHEAGLLRPIQRTLAQNMLALAGRPVRQFATPSARVPKLTVTMSRGEALRIAQHHRRTLLPVETPHDQRRLVGFLRAVDVVLDDSPQSLQPQPLVDLGEHDTYLVALEKLGSTADALGRVVGAQGETLGFVTGRELRLALFRSS